MMRHEANARGYERLALLFTVVLSVLIAFAIAVPHLRPLLDLSRRLP